MWAVDECLRMEIRAERDMLRLRIAVALSAALLVAGCGSGDGTPLREDRASAQAATDCAGPVSAFAKGFGTVTGVAAAYASDAATVARWQEAPRSPRGQTGTGHIQRSQWRDVDPSTPVTVCYLDGTFYPPGGPADRTDRPAAYTRMVFEYGAGKIVPDIVGTREEMPASTPSPSR